MSRRLGGEVGGLLMVVLLVAAVGSCKTAAPAGGEPPAEAPAHQIRPGAERWQRHAMELPASAPVVFWARTDAVLAGASSLRDWLLARPPMYGPNGEQMVDAIRREWKMVIARLGMDPMSPTSWRELGLDPDREIYLAGYPVDDPATRAFVGGLEDTVREHLEIAPDADLAEQLAIAALGPGQDLPGGLFQAAQAAVADSAPASGFRLVVPVTDSRSFVESVHELMRGIEYVSVELDDGERAGPDDDRSRHYFGDATGRWPVVMVRVDDELALIDVLGDRLVGPPAASASAASRAKVREMVARAITHIEAVDSGRPAAPRPPGDPVVGVAADQRGAAAYARLRGYRAALESARAAAVAKRDRVFLHGVYNALAGANNWQVADDQLTGVSYGLFRDADADGFFRLSITLFGAEGAQPLTVDSAPVELGVERRGLGMSLDLGPLADEAWQSWIGVEDPDELIDAMSASEVDPGLFALAFPRLLALVAANFDKILAGELPEGAAATVDDPKIFRRIDVASAGIDMRGLRVQPRFVGLLALDEQATDAQRQQVADLVAKLLDDHVPVLDARAQDEPDGPDNPPSDESAGMPLDELVEITQAPGDAPIFAFVRAASDPPFVFVSYGLDRRASEAELGDIAAAGGETAAGRRTFFARAEPVALFSLMTVFEPEIFEPLDINILAQRIGALVFSVEPELIDGVQTIRYDFELLHPPSLE